MNRTTILIIPTLLLVGLLVFSCFSPSGSCSDPTSSVIMVIDASGSMNEKNQEGTASKIDDAREAAISALDALDNDTEVALIVFYDCSLVITESHFTREFHKIIERIENITPDGKTPLAKTIAKAVSYMENNSASSEGIIIILTDGGETCQGDTVAAAGSVNTITIDTRIHVIDYGSAPSDGLKELAEAGGGSYMRAEDKDELSDYVRRSFDPQWDGPDEDGGDDADDVLGILFLVLLYIAIIIALIALFVALVFILNAIFEYVERSRNKERKKSGRKWWILQFFGWLRLKFGPWWRKRLEKRRKARERRRAERERRAEDRRRERERKRAERERWAALKRRERERGRAHGSSGPGICPFSPLFGGGARRRERRAHEEEMQRLAEERRRAERERVADTIRRVDEEKRRQAEERKRARDERLVKENRKRKELFRELAEMARNEFGIMPPGNLEEMIQQDPYAADVEVARYRGLVEVEKMKRKEQLEKEREEYQKNKKKDGGKSGKKAIRRKGGTSCPSCGEEIRYVASYKRWYCDRCKKYLPLSFEKGGEE